VAAWQPTTTQQHNNTHKHNNRHHGNNGENGMALAFRHLIQLTPTAGY
jgi:hypothetical protein